MFHASEIKAPTANLRAIRRRKVGWARPRWVVDNEGRYDQCRLPATFFSSMPLIVVDQERSSYVVGIWASSSRCIAAAAEAGRLRASATSYYRSRANDVSRTRDAAGALTNKWANSCAVRNSALLTEPSVPSVSVVFFFREQSSQKPNGVVSFDARNRCIRIHYKLQRIGTHNYRSTVHVYFLFIVSEVVRINIISVFE